MRLHDKNDEIMNYHENLYGAVLTKGKRELHLMFKSVAAGELARKWIAELSFNKLFRKSKRMSMMNHNYGVIYFEDLVRK